MPHPVVHFEIVGSDAERLRRFYSELFTWEIKTAPETGDYGLVDRAVTGTIGGGIGASDDPQARGAVFYVAVDDPQAYLDRVEKLGGKTVVPVTEMPNIVTFAQFIDPQGNRIGLVKSTP